MFNTNSIDLNNYNQNITIHESIKFLRVKVHRYGELCMYLTIENDKRKVCDIIKLATDFYHSTVDYVYLVTLPYDDIKKRAAYFYKKRGYVLWKDVTGTCKFKEIVTDCTRENAIELILDYSLSEFL
jgi:hypothetical protein